MKHDHDCRISINARPQACVGVCANHEADVRPNEGDDVAHDGQRACDQGQCCNPHLSLKLQSNFEAVDMEH